MAEAVDPRASHDVLATAPPLERDQTVLAALAREVDGWVTFQGLRRQLGVHQQALSRTLRRLQQQGLVAHDGRGYQLTDVGASKLRGGAIPRRTASAPLPLLTALLPPHVQPGDVAGQLARRWFGGLRWYGQSEGPGETTLRWTSGDAAVTVRVSSGSVQLEVDGPPKAQARAFAAARPVLQALAEIYGVGASGAT